MTTSDTMQAQMRKGVLEFCTLLIIKKKNKAYTSDITQMLRDADMIVVEGTLYPLLSRLRTQGLLDYAWEESRSGPPRKYYTLTNLGTDQLKALSKTWHTLISSINSLH